MPQNPLAKSKPRTALQQRSAAFELAMASIPHIRGWIVGIGFVILAMRAQVPEAIIAAVLRQVN